MLCRRDVLPYRRLLSLEKSRYFSGRRGESASCKPERPGACSLFRGGREIPHVGSAALEGCGAGGKAFMRRGRIAGRRGLACEELRGTDSFGRDGHVLRQACPYAPTRAEGTLAATRYEAPVALSERKEANPPLHALGKRRFGAVRALRCQLWGEAGALLSVSRVISAATPRRMGT